MTKIKPCPFCGSKSIHVYITKGSSFCRCEKCSAIAPDPNAIRCNETEAIEIWNMRVNKK